jgi:zinc transporter ZupT
VVNDFLAGAIVMGFAIAALLFLRFWRRTRELLFLAFAAAFLLFGITQGLLALGGFHTEERSWLYLVRLAGFLMILFAMWGQNRRRRSG